MSEILEILNDRLFPVDRATLFEAFADPEKLVQWWGPEGFSNTISAFDLKPGGHWLITMTADNGTDFHNRWSFEDVVEGQLIQMTHHEPVHVFTLEMTFEGAEPGTRLKWRMLFEPTEENREIQKFIHAANDQNLERLEQVLQEGNQ